MRLFDWLFRTAMLALAGLVTLSMLAAIAAISTEGGPRAWIGRGEPQAVQPAARPDSGPPEHTGAAADEVEAAGDGAVPAEFAGSAPEPERWLEAIAYALVALAGLFAIALLLLANAARDLCRIADALSDRPR